MNAFVQLEFEGFPSVKNGIVAWYDKERAILILLVISLIFFVSNCFARLSGKITCTAHCGSCRSSFESEIFLDVLQLFL